MKKIKIILIRIILSVVLCMLIYWGLDYFKLDSLVKAFIVGAATVTIMNIISRRIIK